jgi:prophage regulatory protein
MSATPRLLRLREVIRLTGLSRSSIYRLESQGRFPSRVRLGDRATAWRSEAVDEWIADRPLANSTPVTVASTENTYSPGG